VFLLAHASARSRVNFSFSLPDGAEIVTQNNVGSNYMVLGVSGETRFFSFRVRAETQRNYSSNYTLQFTVSLSESKAWALSVAATGMATALITDNSTAADGQFRLPFSSAGGSALLFFSIPADASITPPDLSPSLTLLRRGQTVVYSFQVRAANGIAGDRYNISFYVQLSPLTAWSLVIKFQNSALTFALNQDSSVSALDILVPYSSSNDTALLGFTLSDGATVSPSSALLPKQLGARGSVTNFIFTVVAEDGSDSSPYQVRFTVALSPLNGCALSISFVSHIAPINTIPRGTMIPALSPVLQQIRPSDLANDSVRLTFDKDEGAVVIPASVEYTPVPLGSRGSETPVHFIVQSEDGSQSTDVTITFLVQLSGLNGWTAHMYTSDGSVDKLLSSSDVFSDSLEIDVPYTAAHSRLLCSLRLYLLCLLRPSHCQPEEATCLSHSQ
jgi:hypothetical protein